jgi:ribosome-associated heat shock protein Hsp15
MEERMRIDKWLWVVRLYKTRALAADACQHGRVVCENVAVKPSREVKIGAIYEIRMKQIKLVIRAKALAKGRINAKVVEDFIEDLTDKAEYKKLETINRYAFETRDKAIGRPTKKDRRNIENIKF